MHPVLLILPLRILSVGSEQMAINPETHFPPRGLAVVLTTILPVGLWLLEDGNKLNKLPWSCEFLSSPCLVLWVQHISVTAQNEQGKDQVPFFFIHHQGFRGNVITFASFPRHGVKWHAVLCGRCEDAIESSTSHYKRIFSSTEKSLCFPLSESADFVTKKPHKGWRDSEFRFSSMKKQIPIREIQVIQSCCFSLHGSHVCFSSLPPPCHIPSIQTPEQQCQSQNFLFQMWRGTQLHRWGIWDVEEGHSVYTHICQLASAELVSLSLCLIWQSWLIFSSSQCHCHLCCNILWMNKNVQLCLKQLFGVKNICIGKWYWVNPLHRPPGTEWLKQRIVQTFRDEMSLIDWIVWKIEGSWTRCILKCLFWNVSVLKQSM